MKTEIICAIIALAGIALSGFVSWLIAKHAAKVEINRLQTVWAHEKAESADVAFEEMVVAVSRYVKDTSLQAFADAQGSVCIYRAKATGELAQLVDDLDALIIRGTPDRAAVSAKLSYIVQCKRKGER